MPQKKVIVVGAGPGGLTSAMLLAHRGCKVRVFEKADVVGGRNAPITAEGFTWDTGPTFLMMNYILQEMFRETGRRAEDYLRFTSLDPLYRLAFEDLDFRPSPDIEKTRAQIRDNFPGNEDGIDRFMAVEGKRFERLFPCLQKDYDRWTAYIDPIFIRALPHLGLGKSIFDNLGRYFGPEKLKICFTFQAKYLGMSPWDCPALFTILPYVEHAAGILHVRGGLNQISQAMAKVIEEEGGQIELSAPVKRLIIEGRSVKGVELDNGERYHADGVFVNADFAYSMLNLIEPGLLRKYTPERLSKMKISCSTFMLFLGVNRRFDDLPHHNIIFASDYRKNITEVSQGTALSEDPSIYVQNASVTDSSLAPAGKSAIYILVPVPNGRSGIDWQAEGDAFRDRVLDIVERRGGFRGLSACVEYEKRITPYDWEHEYNIFDGATFNLAHNFTQLLSFRPHNRFEELENCWLVGGGTHPGSGLPTIYESARISANNFCRKNHISYSGPRKLESMESVGSQVRERRAVEGA